MKKPFLKRVSAWMAALMLFAVAAPPVVQAAELEARRSEQQSLVDKIQWATAQKIFKGVKKLVESTVARANRHERVSLQTKMLFLDKEHRIFFDIQGLVKVKVPSKKWLRKIQALKDQRGTYTMASNGPIAVDIAATPLDIKENEVQFAIQLDVALRLEALAWVIGENAVGYAGAYGLQGGIQSLADCIDRFDARIMGDAIGTGVAELTKLLGDRDDAPFGDQKKISIHNIGEVGGEALRRHFALAIAYTGAIAGTRLVTRNVTALALGALFPAASASLPILVAVGAAGFFGAWVVRKLMVDLPVKYKFKKLERLYRQQRKGELEQYQSHVVQRLQEEMGRSRDRWVFFELFKKFLEKKMDESDGQYDLTPYEPLLKRVKDILMYRAVNNEDWYAARMHYQMLKAVRRLPPGAAPPGEQ